MAPPGPGALGRGVVVRAGHAIPEAWAGAPEVAVDEEALAAPSGVIAALHQAWASRTPVVVVLGVDPARFRVPASVTEPPWQLGPAFEPWADRLHFLVWANNYDARAAGPAPIWWWARKAERLGASPGSTTDVVLPDGAPAWVDGGPRAPLALDAAVVHCETVELGRLTPQPPAVVPRAELAADQLAAVVHGSGPCRVIAPAGSGKTRVLTERLRHLLGDRGVERELALAVAYNVKAKEEMEARTAVFRPRVQTLNGLGWSLLGRPRLLEERDVRSIVDDLVPRHRHLANTDPIAPYLEGLAAVRLGLRDPAEVEATRDDAPGLALMFDRYRQHLARLGAVDFDEQVYGAIERLLVDGEFRRLAQADCQHLLVDEFQDLTPAHVLLLRLLALPQLDVFGVGDDDQVIYGHASASPRFLVDFDGLFPGGAAHPLEVNYRCPVAVVNAARHLLSYNDYRVAKQIRPGPDADPSPDGLVVRRHPTEDGARSLVELLQGWLDEGVAPADMAVLARVNSLLLAPHVALGQAGIPIDSLLGPDILNRTGCRAALAYLRIGAGDGSMAAADLVEVYRRPSRGLPNWITKWFRDGITPARLRRVGDKLGDPKVAGKLDDMVDDLEVVIRACKGTTRQALAAIGDEVGLGRAMSMLDGSKGGQQASNLDDLEALQQLADLQPDPVEFEPWLQRSFHRQSDPKGVVLSTIHRVKGREWDRVAVYGVTAGIVPHRLAEDLEEERRVLHVGFTRARHRAVLLGDAQRPSPLLGELDGSAPRRARGGDAVRQGGPRAGAAAADRPTARLPTKPGPSKPWVVAEIGLAITANGGYSGTIAGTDADGATLALDSGARLVVRWGEEVTAAGIRALLMSPEEGALRAWRRERARRDSVPAYVVFHDTVLRAIATSRPASLEELARISGVGPTKLDLYGDEILDVVAPA
jgi:DNA helicase-2/ATP-dependent DNA helicase PcrA